MLENGGKNKDTYVFTTTRYMTPGVFFPLASRRRTPVF